MRFQPSDLIQNVPACILASGDACAQRHWENGRILQAFGARLVFHVIDLY